MYVIIKVIRAINISPKHVHFTLPCGYFYKGLFNMVKLWEDLKDLSLNISITIIECFSKNHTWLLNHNHPDIRIFKAYAK